MGYIYLVKNKINNKCYVGQTISIDIQTRWKQHMKMEKNTLGRYIYSAYEKYGIQNFEFKIICICFDEDCNFYEEEYITKYNSLVPSGYNLKSGGNNSKHHPETLKKMSETMKGMKYTPMTEEIKKKISEANKGDKNANFGKKMSIEQRNKIRETIVNKYYSSNNEIREKISKGVKKWRSENPEKLTKVNNKKVGKYDLNGNLLEIYDSIVQAELHNNIYYTTIGKVCKGIKSYKTAAGFVWKYI